MKKHLRFIIASVLSLPCILILVIVLIALILKALSRECPDMILVPFLYECMWATTWPLTLLLFLAIVLISVLLAWFQKTKTQFEIVATSLYTAVVLLHVGYVLWCVGTGQKFDL